MYIDEEILQQNCYGWEKDLAAHLAENTGTHHPTVELRVDVCSEQPQQERSREVLDKYFSTVYDEKCRGETKSHDIAALMGEFREVRVTATLVPSKGEV